MIAGYSEGSDILGENSSPSGTINWIQVFNEITEISTPHLRNAGLREFAYDISGRILAIKWAAQTDWFAAVTSSYEILIFDAASYLAEEWSEEGLTMKTKLHTTHPDPAFATD